MPEKRRKGIRKEEEQGKVRAKNKTRMRRGVTFPWLLLPIYVEMSNRPTPSGWESSRMGEEREFPAFLPQSCC
jgi:hypothetical protein